MLITFGFIETKSILKRATESVQNFLKVLFPKASLSKATGHVTSTLENYRLENKSLQELVEELDVIFSNVVQSRINLFKLIWEKQH